MGFTDYVSRAAAANPVPTIEGQPSRKRGRRKCAICSSITCSGTGGRRLCPNFDENNPEHHVKGSSPAKQGSPQVADQPNLPDSTINHDNQTAQDTTFSLSQPVETPEAGPSHANSGGKRKEMSQEPESDSPKKRKSTRAPRTCKVCMRHVCLLVRSHDVQLIRKAGLQGKRRSRILRTQFSRSSSFAFRRRCYYATPWRFEH